MVNRARTGQPQVPREAACATSDQEEWRALARPELAGNGPTFPRQIVAMNGLHVADQVRVHRWVQAERPVHDYQGFALRHQAMAKLHLQLAALTVDGVAHTFQAGLLGRMRNERQLV